jgi:hypothetical protein
MRYVLGVSAGQSGEAFCETHELNLRLRQTGVNAKPIDILRLKSDYVDLHQFKFKFHNILTESGELA